MQRLSGALILIAAVFSLTISPSAEAANNPSETGGQTGTAACYSNRLKGHHTASGQRYNPNALTASSATIPLGSQVKVTNVQNGRSAVVTVNDRLSAHSALIMDISRRTCRELKFPRGGQAKVSLEVLGSAGSSTSH